MQIGGRMRRMNWAPRGMLTCSAVTASLISPALFAQSGDPLSWQGPDFLLLYIVLMLAASIAVKQLSALLDRRDTESVPTLSTSELGLLAHSRRRAALADITALIADGIIHLDSRLSRLSLVGEAPYPAQEPSASLLRLIRADGDVDIVLKRAEAVYQRSETKLREGGLLRSRSQRVRYAVAVTLPLSTLSIFGSAKVFIGLALGKPVAELIVLVLVTLALACVIGLSSSRVKPAVRRYLDELRDALTPRSRSASGVALPVAVAVMGTVALNDTAYAHWHRATERRKNREIEADAEGCGGCGGGD